MSILISEEFTKELEKDIEKVENSIRIITAYCKKSTLEHIDKLIDKEKKVNKRVLVRFELEDLVSGATDFEIYEYAKQNNWKLFVQFNMHAKVYTIDDKICHLGSANTTNRGLNLISNGNIEMIKRFELDEEENRQLEKVFSDSLLMTDKLYEQMKKQLSTIERQNRPKVKWKEEIIEQNIKRYNVLFQDDFPINDSPIDMDVDEKYLEISKDDTIEEKREKFYNTKIMQWLISELKNKNEIYFGELSQKIHERIFQEPVQYRKDVKRLQAKLYRWIEELGYENIKIDIPKQHSQRISLIK